MSNIISKNESGFKFLIQHIPTGNTALTDAAGEHGGEGSSFTPTDLLEASLATCTATLLCVKAKTMGLPAEGMSVASSHEMADGPRRVGSFHLAITTAIVPDERQRKSLIAASKGCPVRNSLHPSTTIKLTITWGDGTTDAAE